MNRGAAPLLRMSGISKSFGAHRVLHAVDFDLCAGETHVLAGENGAGKSTLIRILGGVHAPDGGRVELRGREVRPRSPREAFALGVSIIHQELSLAPAMSVADNISLGREPTRRGTVDRRRMNETAVRELGRLGLDLDVSRPVGDFPISVQQMIEIAKALAGRAEVLVMDEPTSALSDPEVERLFECVAELRKRGCGIVYITHKLEEIYRVADRITVLRDGRRVITTPAADLTDRALVQQMVGRDLGDLASRKGPAAAGNVRLEAEGLTVRAQERGHPPRVDGVSFSVRAGEILGLAGLQGSGKSQLLLGLFGALGRRTSGKVRVDGRPFRPDSVRRAVRRGMALVTNDRQRTGLVPPMSVIANVTLASLPRVSPGGVLAPVRERRRVRSLSGSLRLQAASLESPVSVLSGGNQQKVVLAKWTGTEPGVLLLDEPTRGVDVGAKQEIYDLLRTWSRAGLAVVLTTSELPELLRLADRILVLHGGRAVAMLDGTEATQETVLHAAMGGR